MNRLKRWTFAVLDSRPVEMLLAVALGAALYGTGWFLDGGALHFNGVGEAIPVLVSCLWIWDTVFEGHGLL